MSSKDSLTPEARGSEEVGDLDLQDVVDGLMRLSIDDLDDLNS